MNADWKAGIKHLQSLQRSSGTNQARAVVAGVIGDWSPSFSKLTPSFAGVRKDHLENNLSFSICIACYLLHAQHAACFIQYSMLHLCCVSSITSKSSIFSRYNVGPSMNPADHSYHQRISGITESTSDAATPHGAQSVDPQVGDRLLRPPYGT